MDCIDWIDSEIAGLQSKIEVLKMQRKVLLDAGKSKKLDELEAAAAPKANMKTPWAAPKGGILEAQRRGMGAPRKPRTSGVKDAVLETISHWPTGINSAGIISTLRDMPEGSIRQALNGLKKRGEIMQDGKMWMMASGSIVTGNCAGEELTA